MRAEASVPRWPVVLSLAVVLAAGAGCQHTAHKVNARIYLDKAQFTEVRFRPTQASVQNGQEIIVDWSSGRLVHRPEGGDAEWQVSPVELEQPHSVAVGADGSFYVSDTGRHRIIRLSDLEQGDFTTAAAIAGEVVYKPHDIVFEPTEGFLYVVDARRQLFRFRGFGIDESVIQFSKKEFRYARSLSVVDGKVYIICSNSGKVIRVDDFDRREYTVFSSPGKKKEASSGSWESCGLVLNDVEYFNGYWYGTNFFTESSGSDNPDRYSLMRWKSWKRFERGQWEDLSHLVDDRIVPYFFFVHEDALYIACLHGKVYLLSEGDGGEGEMSLSAEQTS